jgi:hypothetical protein
MPRSFNKLDIINKLAQGSDAAGLASNTTGATGGVAKALDSISKVPGYEDSLSLSRGVSAAGFSAIKQSFKPMTPNIPQNLTEIKSKTDIALAVAQTVPGDTGDLARAITNAKNEADALGSSPSKLARQNKLPSVGRLVGSGSQSAISSAVATGLSGLPGGARTATAIVNNIPGAKNLAAPGLSDISKVAVDLASKAFGGQPVFGSSLSLPSAISGGLSSGGLTKGLLSGLPAGVQAQLQSALSSLTTGGGSTIKLPTVAFNTFDRSGITKQIDRTLGNPIIPRPTVMGDIIPAGGFVGPLSSLRDQAFATTRKGNDYKALAKELESVQKNITQNRIATANALTEYNLAVASFPIGDPRIEETKRKWEKLEATKKNLAASEATIQEQMDQIGHEFGEAYVPGQNTTTRQTTADDPSAGLESLIASQTLTSDSIFTTGNTPVTEATSSNQNSLSGETTFSFADYGNGAIPAVTETIVDSVQAPDPIIVIIDPPPPDDPPPDDPPDEVENTVDEVMGPELPPTPPAGGGGCVLLDSYIPLVETKLSNERTVRHAWQLQEGHDISLNTADEELNTYIGSVVFNVVDLQPCVRIETAQGISLNCSTTAPIFTKDSEFVDAPDLMNKQIRCMKDDKEFWDEVVSIESIGEKFVAVINAGDTAFWAGEQDGSYVLHHNAFKFTTDLSINFHKK